MHNKNRWPWLMLTLVTFFAAATPRVSADVVLSTGDVFVVTQTARLARVDPLDGSTVDVGPTGVVLTDLAFAPSGALFGITFSALYSVDPDTGATMFIGPLGVGTMNALTFRDDGTLFAADNSIGQVYTVNTSTGAATALPMPLGGGHVSSGDLEFDDLGNLYLSANFGISDLVAVDQTTGEGTLIGSMGFSNVFGLAFSNGTMYGFSHPSNQVFTVDLITGAGSSPFALDPATPVFGASAQQIPEPGTLALFLSGGLGLLAWRRQAAAGGP